MEKLVRITEILKYSPAELAGLSSAQLLEISMDCARLQNVAREVQDRLNCALDLKYSKTAHEMRHLLGKETGTVRFFDEKVCITATLPKRVEWDQQGLRQVAETLRKMNLNPEDYIHTSFQVHESKFAALPKQLKSLFLPARTLKPTKEVFKLFLAEEDGNATANHKRQ